LRILTVTNMYPSSNSPGEGAFVAEQVKSLRALGLSVDVLTISGRRGARKYARAIRMLNRVLKDASYDLVHAHYGLTGAVAALQRRVPVVTTLHGSDTFVPWQRRISWVVVRATTPIFVTQAAAARLGVPAARVIPCGVDLEVFKPRDRGEARDRLGWPQDRAYVLFPGSRGDAVKCPSLFDEALEVARLEIGDVAGASLERLTRERVAEIMNAVDVTLLTSVSEGSPVAVKESLACGTGVVSVPVGDVPALIGGLPGCAIAARDPFALGKAVVSALREGRHPHLRDRVLGFSLERVAEQIVALYNSVLDGRR
jgi:teichuronic acid biosynthesis glycosyltransferase TuaC